MWEEPHASIQGENVQRVRHKERQIIISVTSIGASLGQSNTGLLSAVGCLGLGSFFPVSRPGTGSA